MHNVLILRNTCHIFEKYEQRVCQISCTKTEAPEIKPEPRNSTSNSQQICQPTSWVLDHSISFRYIAGSFLTGGIRYNTPAPAVWNRQTEGQQTCCSLCWKDVECLVKNTWSDSRRKGCSVPRQVTGTPARTQSEALPAPRNELGTAREQGRSPETDLRAERFLTTSQQNNRAKEHKPFHSSFQLAGGDRNKIS